MSWKVVAVVLLGVAGVAYAIVVCPPCQSATLGTDPNACGATIGGLSACQPSPFLCTAPGFYRVGTYSFLCFTSSGICQYTITVKDMQMPTIACGSNITVPATSAAGAVVTFANATASDNCVGVTVSSNPLSGSQFPLGTTTVTQTATDAAGNKAACTFTVTVVPAGAVPAISRWALALMASALAAAGALALRIRA
jgi:hypothetical protein